MPTDTNGNYSLPAGYLATTGNTIVTTQHNPIFEDVQGALTARLMRSGAGGMTGQLKAIDGTAAAPGITFGTALNSGFYKTANGWGMSIAGTLVAEFGAAGMISGLAASAIADRAIRLAKILPSGQSRLIGTRSNGAVAILGAANNGSGQIRLQVASTATFTSGDPETVWGVTGTTEANGNWFATVVDATHIDLTVDSFTAVPSAFVNSYISGGFIGGGFEMMLLGAGLQMSGRTLSATMDPTLVPNYKSGLTLSAAGGTSTFGISAGAASDSGNTVLMKLASAFTKTTSSWVVGTGNGALDTGAIAINTWYHVYEIERPDTGVVDVCVSVNPTAPVLGFAIPVAYIKSRWIGAMKTDGSSQWVKFTQTGPQFVWAAGAIDVSAIATTAARVSKTLSVPTGVVVEAMFRAQINFGGNGAIVFTSLQENDQDPTSSTFLDLLGSAAGVGAAGAFRRLTNTSAQIGVRSTGAGHTYSINTYGWIATSFDQ